MIDSTERTAEGHCLMEFYGRLPENLAKPFWKAFVLWRDGELRAEISGSTVTFTGEGASVRFGIGETVL